MTTENTQISTTSAPDTAPAVAPVVLASPDVTPPGLAETTVAAATTEPAVPDDVNADEAPPRNRAQERIQDLVAERNAAKEYADYWREKALEVMQTSGKPAPQAAPTAAVVPNTPPTLEQFGYDQSKWSEAYGKWADTQIEVKVGRVLEQREQVSQQQQIAQQFEEKLSVFRESHPDFDIVMANPRLPQLDKVSAAMIVASDHSADISYKLGKNPDLATRISRMGPTQQALAIGRLENEVISEKSKPSPQVAAPEAKKPAPAQVTTRDPQITRAPTPLEPVPAGGAPEVSPENMDTDAWMRERARQVRQGRARAFRR